MQAAWDTLPAPAFARVVAHVLPQRPPATYEPAGSLLPSAAERAARGTLRRVRLPRTARRHSVAWGEARLHWNA